MVCTTLSIAISHLNYTTLTHRQLKNRLFNEDMEFVSTRLRQIIIERHPWLLFDDTIKNNIVFYRDELSDDNNKFIKMICCVPVENAKKYNEKRAIRVVTEVNKVLDIVSFNDLLIKSNNSICLYFLKFSRI